MRAVFRLGLSAILAAILSIFYAMPAGQSMEREVGLGLLYALRGEVDPPKEAIVIGLDADSISWFQRNSRALEAVSTGLDGCLTERSLDIMEESRNVNIIPRALYICLLQTLNDRTAQQIVFDINFNADKPDDKALAVAIKQAGNVLLFERVMNESVVRRLKPTKILNDAAAAAVVFQTDGTDEQIATGYPTFLPYAADARIMPVEAWSRYTGAPQLKLQSSSNFQPVWYYGGPETIPTHSLRDVFQKSSENPLPLDLSDTVVFIGVSDSKNPNAYDHFRMPAFSGTSAQIGGVEIAATAFLNLLHDEPLVAMSRLAAIMTVFAVVFVLIAVALQMVGAWGLLAVPALGAGYIGVASLAFSSAQIWMPVAVPLLLGMPAAILTTLFLRYSAAKNIVRRLAPRQVAEQLLRRSKVERGESSIEQSTIMFIDLEGSTDLGERMETEAYQQVMTRFYDASADAIESHDGMIVEFKGDGILALFNESIAGPTHPAKACRAALGVSNNVDAVRFADKGDTNARLKLRFGIHSGTVSTGSVGSQRRFSFNALGDSVNTAARLEQFGKIFSDEKTDVIVVSGKTLLRAQLPDSSATLIGREKLRGKSEEIEIYRLMVDD